MEWPKFETVHNLQTEKIYVLKNFNDVKNSIKQVIFNKDDTQSPYTKTYHENLTNGTFVLFNILDFERSVKLVLQYFTLCAFYVSVNTILNSRFAQIINIKSLPYLLDILFVYYSVFISINIKIYEIPTYLARL